MATMNFFQKQDEARANTVYLTVAFAFAIMGVIAMMWMVTSVIWSLVQYHRDVPISQAINYFDRTVLNPVAGGTLIIITIGCLIKVCQLAAGGKAVANMFRARLVQHATTDPKEKLLLNVVEEMSIASQTPMPQVYVLDNETGINAFAAGYSRGDTVICITRGCLDQLTRDELQGVIGHEYSHILNGDMALNMQLLSMLFGITCIADLGYIMMRAGFESNEKESLYAVVVGMVVWVIGSIGALFGGLLQAAISRQRESLADAAATQFTRNPEGLRNALIKIAGYSGGSTLRSAAASQVNHFLFSEAGGFASLFATHPPLEDRIKALDPNFDLSTLKRQYLQLLSAQALQQPPGLPGEASAVIASLAGAAGVPVTAGSVGGAGSGVPPGTAGGMRVPGNNSADSPAPDSGASPLERMGISLPVRRAARDPLTATALIFGLLLSPFPGIRVTQLDTIRDKANALIMPELMKLVPELDKLNDDQKIALVCVAVSSLRGMSIRQYDEFSAIIAELVQADGKIDLFEYMVSKSVSRNLESYFRSRPRKSLELRFEPLSQQIQLALSMVAYETSQPADVPTAYERAIPMIACLTDSKPVGLDVCTIANLDKALADISQSCFDIRAAVVSCATKIALYDKVITPDERALLFALADALEVRAPDLPTAQSSAEVHQ